MTAAKLDPEIERIVNSAINAHIDAMDPSVQPKATPEVREYVIQSAEAMRTNILVPLAQYIDKHSEGDRV